MLINDWVINNARRFPNRSGIVCRDVRYTFREVDERVNRLANALIKLGLQKGDRVAFLDRNCPFYLEFYFGVTRAGLVAVPLNYRLVGREYTYLLKNSGAKAIIVGEEYVGTIDGIRDAIPTVKHFISLVPANGYYLYEDIVTASGADDPKVTIGEDELAIIGYTSGTTAKPKGVMLTHRNIIANAMNFLSELPLRQEDICYSPFPLFHSGAYCVMAYYSRGCTQVFDDFEVVNTFEVLQKERVNFMFIPAGGLVFLPSCPNISDYDRSALRHILTGGSRTPVPVIRWLFDAFPRLETLYDTFALTEAAPLVCVIPKTRQMLLDDMITESSGGEAYGTYVRLVDDQDREVPLGGVGEIVVRGDNVMRGYWAMPEETANTLRSGWLHTGDMGRFDGKRHLYVVDRKKDMILSGGENVASKEVEEVIYEHPAIADVAVIGVPDEKWGERVHAVIVLKSGQQLLEEEIIQFCKERLAGYKRPRSVEIVIELPRNPSGKLLKQELKKKYR
jgi:acyl-CoA synthetase (AMP-forming)/AMP-acid ligase II